MTQADYGCVVLHHWRGSGIRLSYAARPAVRVCALVRNLPDIPQEIFLCNRWANMAVAESAAAVIDRISIAVLTAREAVHDNPWITERWKVLGVVAGEALGTTRSRRCVRVGPDAEEYLWTGFTLRLSPAEADSYYYNLIGDNPSVYVYAQRDDSGEPVPQLVGLDYIEAMAHSESGNDSYAVPMPPEVYRIVEQFVLEHFEPEEPRLKRKHERNAAHGEAHEPKS